MISVVLPTFNGARYLAESIQSVIDQTFTDWELIIVDDCSTDETPEIIARFVRQEPRIRSTRHDTNRKLPAALNTGFADARGEFLTWTSDDNLYLPEALDTMALALTSQPETSIVYCNTCEIDEQGTVLGVRRTGEPDRLVYGNVIGACFLYRRQVHDLIGWYDESLYLAEDYDFWLRAAGHVTFRKLECEPYHYRTHPGSLTAVRACEIAVGAHRALARSLPQMQGLTTYARAHGYLRLAREAYARGENVAARRFLLRSLWRLPRTIWRENRYLLRALVPLPKRDGLVATTRGSDES